MAIMTDNDNIIELITNLKQRIFDAYQKDVLIWLKILNESGLLKLIPIVIDMSKKESFQNRSSSGPFSLLLNKLSETIEKAQLNGLLGFYNKFIKLTEAGCVEISKDYPDQQIQAEIKNAYFVSFLDLVQHTYMMLSEDLNKTDCVFEETEHDVTSCITSNNKSTVVLLNNRIMVFSPHAPLRGKETPIQSLEGQENTPRLTPVVHALNKHEINQGIHTQSAELNTEISNFLNSIKKEAREFILRLYNNQYITADCLYTVMEYGEQFIEYLSHPSFRLYVETISQIQLPARNLQILWQNLAILPQMDTTNLMALLKDKGFFSILAHTVGSDTFLRLIDLFVTQFDKFQFQKNNPNFLEHEAIVKQIEFISEHMPRVATLVEMLRVDVKIPISVQTSLQNEVNLIESLIRHILNYILEDKPLVGSHIKNVLNLYTNLVLRVHSLCPPVICPKISYLLDLDATSLDTLGFLLSLEKVQFSDCFFKNEEGLNLEQFPHLRCVTFIEEELPMTGLKEPQPRKKKLL